MGSEYAESTETWLKHWINAESDLSFNGKHLNLGQERLRLFLYVVNAEWDSVLAESAQSEIFAFISAKGENPNNTSSFVFVSLKAYTFDGYKSD